MPRACSNIIGLSLVVIGVRVGHIGENLNDRGASFGALPIPHMELAQLTTLVPAAGCSLCQRSMFNAHKSTVGWSIFMSYMIVTIVVLRTCEHSHIFTYIYIYIY